ncbi:MAG TPA: alpha-amylase family glycosyl hydrolase [Dongiaceae bacterium]|jgi:alpha-glucosidase|nr:alpha-amylase family glycosyl hydrolase [Dongiaceae bacterium]
MSAVIFEPTAHRRAKVAPRRDDWWRGAVIYQIYPRSFQDSNGDGIGDLPGIVARLDHVARLGADVIWISPFFKSPMKDYGYDVADYRHVDPLFGTDRDFDTLLAAAHERDLRVMIDLVPSHTSNQHAWFLESRESRDNPKSDWYVWADPKADGTPPTNWLSIFGGSAWEWEPRRAQYYLHNFLKEQPDLNFHNPEVIAALLDVCAFWLDRGVDGFRVDAIDFGVHDILLRDNPVRPACERSRWDGNNPFNFQIPLYNKNRPELSDLFLKPLYELTEKYSGKVLLGEISGDRVMERAAEYTNGGGFDFCYSFDLMHAPPTPAAIRSVVERQERVIEQGWACWAFANHDVDRASSRFAQHWGMSPYLGLFIPVLLTSLRGSACLYQGDELGLPQSELSFTQLRDPYGIAFWPHFKGRDGVRTPIPWEADAPYCGFSRHEPWLPIGAGHREYAVDRQRSDPHSTLSLLGAFLAWRKKEPALKRGAIRFLDDLPENTLGFVRTLSDIQIYCYFNFGTDAQQLALPTLLTPLPAPGARAEVRNRMLALEGHGFFMGR